MPRIRLGCKRQRTAALRLRIALRIALVLSARVRSSPNGGWPPRSGHATHAPGPGSEEIFFYRDGCASRQHQPPLPFRPDAGRFFSFSVAPVTLRGTTRREIKAMRAEGGVVVAGQADKADSLPDSRNARGRLGRTAAQEARQPSVAQGAALQRFAWACTLHPCLHQMRAARLFIGGAQQERPGPAAAYPRCRLSHDLLACPWRDKKRKLRSRKLWRCRVTAGPGHSRFEKDR
jgi:hypothetical protein